MSTKQGDLALLGDPVARALLQSAIPARLAYTWLDGTPRVVPIWFHWTGEEIVLGTPVRAPKVKALTTHPSVALTIDDTAPPYKALLMRGMATVERVDGIVPEYAAAAERYFGADQGRSWVADLSRLVTQMVRVTIRPTWVAILDFETRFPSALPA